MRVKKGCHWKCSKFHNFLIKIILSDFDFGHFLSEYYIIYFCKMLDATDFCADASPDNNMSDVL